MDAPTAVADRDRIHGSNYNWTREELVQRCGKELDHTLLADWARTKTNAVRLLRGGRRT
ncbi:hypothetical protein P0W64_16355 [Tsukamurella sp. 8F]|uniref:hypothetical protein n=1 Tax=unclassified Tsukamurella TaxID=2633480 RepID=UPI0023B9717B|nr:MULTISPECIES: hypothetical protein [unclassified Tsukamurella]MDF0531108.1 hypothetical protein [Tsukamurella sp. 8J]MDF0588354.1 hypothetical protein [Tsukamurella sp. 8F]